MNISSSLIAELIQHAIEEAPNECCGIISSQAGRAVEVYRAHNRLESPLRYEFDPREQYRIQMAIEDAGLGLGAIYHSHTHTEAYPSETDIKLAFYPEALYLIVGLADEAPVVRAFRILDGVVSEVRLEID